ncbi:thioredoxin domain-containing protein [Sinorhizobium meliloti]|uniref:thioredoxin domain-containing protein n=1 Tax=Rhizobium meliloti TaxID=382 RepID=UPI00299F06D4
MPKLLAPAGLPDTPIGSISAPVTLIEYSPPTCSHCVEYRTRVAPRIHAEFVTTGKVRSIFRPFVRHNVDLVIFMLGEWQGGTKREEVIASFYRGGMSFDEMKAVITSLETSQNWSERK